MPKSLKRARPTAAAAVAQELARRVAIILVISQLRPGASRISQESFIHPSTTRSPAAPEPSGVARRQWSSAAIDGSEARVFDLLFVDDGMFDPRRDYWSHSRRNEADLESTPASLNRESAARGLATASSNCGTASSSEPCCIECFGLSYCDVLNGYKVEDKYFPGEATILGSCDNLEDRASRLEVFGPSKTFRDTDACREMVIDYTCLWWGSTNEMYDNRCGVEAQVYPCRSYCVQLAKTCANNVVDWQELCRAIDCPPTDEECMPGPYTQDIDEACYLYEYHSPLNAGQGIPAARPLVLVASVSIMWLVAVTVAGLGF